MLPHVAPIAYAIGAKFFTDRMSAISPDKSTFLFDVTSFIASSSALPLPSCRDGVYDSEPEGSRSQS